MAIGRSNIGFRNINIEAGNVFMHWHWDSGNTPGWRTINVEKGKVYAFHAVATYITQAQTEAFTVSGADTLYRINRAFQGVGDNGFCGMILLATSDQISIGSNTITQAGECHLF